MGKDKLAEKQRKASIARRIKEVREQKGLSQHQLAVAIDCTQGRISQWESDGDISWTVLIAVCDALGCSVDYLIGRDIEYGTGTHRERILRALEKLPCPMQDMIVSMVESAERVHTSRGGR